MTGSAPTATNQSSNLRGIGLMLASCIIFSMKDGFAKHLGGIYPVAELLWAQYSLMTLVVLAVVLKLHGVRALWPTHPWTQMLRGGLGVLTVGMFYLALTEIPLADATALAFTSPIVVTILAPILLKESVGIRRWAAVLAGFIGILLIVQPGFDEFRLGSLYAVSAGAVFALFQITTRQLADQESPMVTVLYTALVGAVIMNALMPALWITPTLKDAGLLFVMASLAAGGQAFLIYAFVAAPAAVVAPFFYSTIIVATTVGYFVFGEFPNPLAWAGIALVIACGVYIAVREAKAERSA